MTALRVAVLADPGSIHARRWLWRLRDRGAETHLLTLDEPPDAVRGQLQGIAIHSPGSVTGIPGLRTLVRLLFLHKTLRVLRPDILNAHFVSGPGVLAALTGFRPIALTAYGSDLFVVAPSSWFKSLITSYALRAASVVTADSQDLLDQCIRRGCPARNAHLLQFGVDGERFSPGPGDRAAFDIPAEAKVIYSARAMAPRYNIMTIVEAMPRVIRSHPNALFLFATHVSDAAYQAACVERARALGVVDRMKLLPPIDYVALPSIFRLADLAVSIPSTDATPVTLFESMATGTPFIGTDLPSLREWIRDGQNGFLVAPDAQALAEVIERYLADPDRWRQAFREPNLRLVRERADESAAADQLVALYRSVASNTARERSPC